MPFEHKVMTYWEWLLGDPTQVRFFDASTWSNLGFLFGAFLILSLISVVAPLIWFLIAAVQHGPGEGFYLVARSVYRGVTEDLPGFSPRRMLAIAKLAVQEAIRNRVLVGFAVFVLLMLFAGLFLDVENSNPARTYISFVLTTTNYLVLLMALFLSAFSLPNDIKNKTIYTVVTKPIRAGEIVMGRVVGFALVGTVMLIAMGLVSYVFVKRGLSHTHELNGDDFVALPVGSGKEGSTSMDRHHRHRVRMNADGTVTETELSAGHFHPIEVVGEGADKKFVVGAARGDLIARSPVFGKMRILDREGNPGAGVNVGTEWTYRGYIEGGNNRSAATWTFSGITPQRYPGGLPLELNLAVFRTYKGNIERGVLGEIIIRNPNPEARVRSSGPIPFESHEFTSQRFTIPAEMNAAATADGASRKINLFEDLTYNGQVEVVIRCAESAQYFGVAQADVYLRPKDASFELNFAKGYVSLWLQMLLVTGFGVTFSTFLSGPVAMMATLSAIVLGFFGNFLRDVTLGIMDPNGNETVVGGGPIESLIRLLTQANVSSDLEVATIVEKTIKVIDMIIMQGMRGMTYVLPDYRQFDTTQFVASGYNIYIDLIAQHLTAGFVYVIAVGIVGYFFLKTREVAG